MMRAALARILLLVAVLTLAGLPVNQALAGQVGAPCVLVVDWLINKDRVIELADLLAQDGMSSAYILLPGDRESDNDDIEALANIVLGLKPELVIIHLSSFSDQRKGRDNRPMAQFLALVETNRDIGYLPRYVVYSRTREGSGISGWAPVDDDIFGDRLSIVQLPNSGAHAKGVSEEVKASHPAACATTG